jgi:hypothetical protein
MTTASASIGGTGEDTSGRRSWRLAAIGLAVLALVLSSTAITEVTRAVSLVATRSRGMEGVFVVRDCEARAGGLDPRADHATCDGVFLGQDGSTQPRRSELTVRRQPPADGSRPVEGRQQRMRGWGDDVSAPVAVATAIAALLLALIAWAGAIHAFRKVGGGRLRALAGPRRRSVRRR